MQNLRSSSLLSKTIKIKINRCIIFPLVLYGSGTMSLTLRKERRLMVFESTVLRKVSGPKRNEAIGSGENYIVWSLMICTSHPILFG